MPTETVRGFHLPTRCLPTIAAAHPDNVVLVDWDATANANAQVLGSDGIHPSMDSDIYAKAVRQAIEQWIASGR